MKKTPNKIYSVNVQIISHDDSIILVRGATEIFIKGRDASGITIDLLQKCTNGVTIKELLALYPEKIHDEINKLFNDLLAQGILFYSNNDNNNFKINEKESELDIFGWQFGKSEKEIKKILSKHILHILGINYISIKLFESLKNAGFKNIKIVDYLPLNNQKVISSINNSIKKNLYTFEDWAITTESKKPSCLIATCDYGGQPVIKYWNQYSVENNVNFFPLILDKSIGYIGPFVIPSDSACYECMCSRQDSNEEDPELFRYIQSNVSNKVAINGFHPSMPNQIADIGATELSKFYLNISFSMVNRLSIYKFLIPDLKAQHILKVPRCRVCSPLHREHAVNTDKSILIDPEQNLRNVVNCH